jgi:hypothetical protein
MDGVNMSERSNLIEHLRGEIVGPARDYRTATVVSFADREWKDSDPRRAGPVLWQQGADQSEEVLYFDRETPHRKYGTGLLHPDGPSKPSATINPDDTALNATDTVGVDIEPDDSDAATSDETSNETGPDDDFEVSSLDVRHPSTIGLSACLYVPSGSKITVNLRSERRFQYQLDSSAPFKLNGFYEQAVRAYRDERGSDVRATVWRRRSAVGNGIKLEVPAHELVDGKVIRRQVPLAEGIPISLLVEAFPRKVEGRQDVWLITVVLRNVSPTDKLASPREAVLFQSYFEVGVDDGQIERYPESQRPFQDLDEEEQSLALLYRDSSTWGVGHGCAAGWDSEPGVRPALIYADVMPAVQLPSMTPDIHGRNGQVISLSMRELSDLSDDGTGAGWDSLKQLANEYRNWIELRRAEANGLDNRFVPVADRHLRACEDVLERIDAGITLLQRDESARKAFRLANLSMLLQQIATKILKRRPLEWDSRLAMVRPVGTSGSPWELFKARAESGKYGTWRAFQAAFLLMSLNGVADGTSDEREIVDLIWFPTGGGKTEAYLGVVAFYLFHQRLRTEGALRKDGTNVLMRYTLRMLTTQQFQRAASLICAMEALRRHPEWHGMGELPGRRFSLGLWIGGDGSPNRIEGARTDIRRFAKGDEAGNPLVLIECPWCRAEIGRFDGPRPRPLSEADWNRKRVRGISDDPREGPLLLCPDSACEYGQPQAAKWLPIEVIDERIYRHSPSLIIGTADKLAMVAYRPLAGSLFGRERVGTSVSQISEPPGLIIQDELHLISGPLGTMYGLYEGVFERLCTVRSNGRDIKPKLIASTATIRGASDQVTALYARPDTRLFPSPGLTMGDSFFGLYARDTAGNLRQGRLYLGIHANDYGSILTTQVRTFASALYAPQHYPEDARDAWWTLLVFYNSIRELGGAKTLFDSDIRSRLKFMFSREGVAPPERRNLRIVDELTGRLSQAEIVTMMDKLSTEYGSDLGTPIDACLASNIIEVGVDIDRLSLMGVVGQPKTTAQYIQVTGRVGRKWWERPGLILTIYNPSKSRDRSHFEQFHSYHRRLYERVEPTSATPFAISAIQRALPGALLVWARQQSDAPVGNLSDYRPAIDEAMAVLQERCEQVQKPEDVGRSLAELEKVKSELLARWQQNPQSWEEFPPSPDGEYLMLWPGQFATRIQLDRGMVVASSMRQVDRSAELEITQGYALTHTQP